MSSFIRPELSAYSQCLSWTAYSLSWVYTLPVIFSLSWDTQLLIVLIDWLEDIPGPSRIQVPEFFSPIDFTNDSFSSSKFALF